MADIVTNSLASPGLAGAVAVALVASLFVGTANCLGGPTSPYVVGWCSDLEVGIKAKPFAQGEGTAIGAPPEAEHRRPSRTW